MPDFYVERLEVLSNYLATDYDISMTGRRLDHSSSSARMDRLPQAP